MDKLIEFVNDWWSTLTIGPAPKLNVEYLVQNAASPTGLKWKITHRVKKILKNFPANNHKFGKSGQPPYRAKQDDYREAPYKTMFLLYQSDDHEDVSNMEVYYIKLFKHLKQNDNESESVGHLMRSL